MFETVKSFFSSLFPSLFSDQDSVRIGLYGPPNGGKTTLANRISEDWMDEEMGSVSEIAHETREVKVKEEVTIEKDGKSLSFNLVDTPGIATKIDYEEFVEQGMEEDDARSRAKEATKGVIESIKWLDSVDVVIIVLDAAVDPYTQVNISTVGNLEARDIPALLVANKIDLDEADVEQVRSAFPQYDVVPISAKEGDNIETFYQALVDMV
jgi:small GTP-binding protein